MWERCIFRDAISLSWGVGGGVGIGVDSGDALAGDGGIAQDASSSFCISHYCRWASRLARADWEIGALGSGI